LIVAFTTKSRSRFADEVIRESERVALPALVAFAGELPGYTKLNEQALRASLEPGLELVLRPIIEEARVPTEALEGWFIALAETRAEQVPIEAGLRYLHRAGQELIAALMRAAQTLKIEAHLLEEPASILMETIGDAMTKASAVFAQVEAQRIVRSALDRDAFVHGALTGTLDTKRLRAGAEVFGLSMSRPYLAARARGRIEDREVTQILGRVTATAGSDVFAIVERAPDAATPSGTIGLGPEVDLSSLASSFAVASRTVDTACAFGLRGVFTMEDLGLLPAVVAEDTIGERLAERFIHPVLELDEFGDLVLDSVRLFLEDMRPQPVARKLHVHPNTLRYRLRRFQEITGARLEIGGDVAEVWWALQRRRVQQTRTGTSADADGQ
jgi:putative transposase